MSIEIMLQFGRDEKQRSMGRISPGAVAQIMEYSPGVVNYYVVHCLPDDTGGRVVGSSEDMHGRPIEDVITLDSGTKAGSIGTIACNGTYELELISLTQEPSRYMLTHSRDNEG